MHIYDVGKYFVARATLVFYLILLDLNSLVIFFYSSFSWRRQTRLRPNNAGDGLRGDVYYYSPCGKKLRTYPELNNVSSMITITNTHILPITRYLQSLFYNISFFLNFLKILIFRKIKG